MKRPNQIFARVVKIIFAHDGTFDKYIGDAIMAFYGAPLSYEDDALRAVKTALKMQEAMRKLQEEEDALKELGMGIGIYTGYAVVGNLGSEQVMNYTVIGDTPNMASRFQGHAKAGQVLIDAVTYEAVIESIEVKEMEPILLKGKKAPIAAYEAVCLLENEEKAPEEKDFAE